MKTLNTVVRPGKLMCLGLVSLFSTGMASAISIPQETVVPVGAGQTIQSAYDGIPSAFTGKYVIELQSGYDPTTETYPIVLGAKSGSSAANTITIKPGAGVTKTISAPFNAPASASTSAAASDVANGINKFKGTIIGLGVGYKIFGMGLSSGTTVASITDDVVKLDKVITYAADNLRQNTTWIAVPADGTILMSASALPINTNIATLTTSGFDMNTLSVGMLVGGNGIPFGTTITLIDAATKKITLSNNIGLGKQNATLYFADPATGIQVTPTSFNIPVADASTAGIGYIVTGTSVGSNITILSIVGNDLFTNQVGGTFTSATALTLTYPGTCVLRLNGAQFITIDGGNKANLTIENTNTTGNTIQIINDASNNTVKNCTVKGASTSSTNGVGNILIGNTTGTTGCDYNTIDNCDINGLLNASAGVFISGSALATSNNSNTVSNCNIFDFNTVAANSIYGVYANANSSLTTVKDNQIYWTASLSPTVGNIYYGISVGGESNTITGNKVGHSTTVAATTITSTSTPRFVGILTSGGPSAAPTTVSGNTIANINLTTASLGNDWNVGYGMIAGIAADNAYPTTNTAARTYITVSNNNVNNLILTSNGAPTSNVYWNAIGITLNAHFPTITNNTVHTISSIAGTITGAAALKQSARGIQAVNGSVVGATISGNTIYNITAGDINSTNATNQITALSCAPSLIDGNGSSIVEKNMIYNIKALNNANTAIAYGIQTYNNTAAVKDIIVRNNVVRLGSDVSCNGAFYGYFQQEHNSVNSKVYFYNNTIYIGGTAKDAAAATANTACIYRKPAKAAATTDFKNNILVNKRSGGITGKHSAILLTNAADYNGSTQFLTSNNNLFDLHADALVGAITTSVTGAPSAIFATLDIWNNAIDDVTAPGTTYDAASVTGDPLFVNAAGGDNADEKPNMHISKNSIAVGNAVDLSSFVAEDFDGDSRITATKFVIGADIPDLGTAISASAAGKSGVYAIGKNIFFSGVAGAASVLDAAGALVAQVSSAQVAAGSVNLSDLKSGLYVVVVNGKATKVVLK